MSARLLRIDRIALEFDAKGRDAAPGRARAMRTPEGYLDVDAYLARDGLLRYSDGRVSWLEFRPRAELEAAAATWAHAPVTDDHPPVMVDATNAIEYARGVVISDPRVVEVDGVAYLAARLRVHDARLIDKILGGQRELSIGFLADVHPEAGSHAGQRYDAVQRALAGNHVASVERGRAGPAVRVLLDSAPYSAELCYSAESKPDHEVPPVSKPTLDSARAPRVIKLPAGVKMDAVKAWCANAQIKIKGMDEVGLPTTMAKLVGPDGTEIEVPTWVAALVAEALDAHKAAGESQAPAEAAPELEAPADESGAPADAPNPKPEDEEKKTMSEPMTPDTITALVRRRGRLERLSAVAGLPSATIDAADDTALARAYVAHVLPHAKARADAAEGAVLDALVEVAASTPVAAVVNPFEVRAKADAGEPEDDPIVASYANHLAR